MSPVASMQSVGMVAARSNQSTGVFRTLERRIQFQHVLAAARIAYSCNAISMRERVPLAFARDAKRISEQYHRWRYAHLRRSGIDRQFASVRIAVDGGEQADGKADQSLRAVQDAGVEGQGIAGPQVVDLGAVAVADFALEHVEEGEAVLAGRPNRVGRSGERDYRNLDVHRLVQRVGEQPVGLPRVSPAAD